MENMNIVIGQQAIIEMPYRPHYKEDEKMARFLGTVTGYQMLDGVWYISVRTSHFGYALEKPASEVELVPIGGSGRQYVSNETSKESNALPDIPQPLHGRIRRTR